MITSEKLKTLLDYDPETGVFTRKVSKGRAGAGSVAGNIDTKGYLRISIDKREYRAHRLAWLYVYGAWPDGEIDHIDRNRSNNSINNLRVASHTENQFNATWRTNTSGYKGVSWIKRDKRWQAKIRVDGACKNLGYYKTPEEASAAYQKVAMKLHGEFFNAT